MRSCSLDFQPRRPGVAGRRHLDLLACAKHDGAKDAPYRLRKARRRVLRRRAGIGIAAVPGGRAAQPVRGQAMNGECREHARYRHEQKDQQSVVGAAAGGNRDDRKPLRADLRRHVFADQSGTDRRQRINECARKNADQQAQRRQNQHRSQRIGIGFRRVFGRGRARAAEKRHAVGLDETGSRKRGGKRQQRADGRYQQLQPPGRQLRAEQNGLKGEPLGNKTVERR